MRANRARDTAPEIALRQALYARGLRYRVNARLIPESRMTVDIAFPRIRLAVEVHGCFWHGCPAHHRPATHNSSFWAAKIVGNIERDARKRDLLLASGWNLIVVWEHDDVATAVDEIAQWVRASEK